MSLAHEQPNTDVDETLDDFIADAREMTERQRAESEGSNRKFYPDPLNLDITLDGGTFSQHDPVTGSIDNGLAEIRIQQMKAQGRGQEPHIEITTIKPTGGVL